MSGGARGLGFTVAEGMLEHGLSKVALLDVDANEGSKAVELLRSRFGGRENDIVFKVLDVINAEQVSQVIQEVATLFGRIDVLTTFAGIVNSIRAVDYTPEMFRKICDVNTTGTFLTAQAVGQ